MTPELQAQESGAVGQVNNNYGGLSQQLQTSLSGRGFGTSGKVVTGQRNLDVSRINAVGSTQDTFAGLAQQQRNQTLAQAMQFGFADPGSKSTSTTGGFGTILSQLMQAGGLAYGLAKMGGGSGGGFGGSGGFGGGGYGSEGDMGYGGSYGGVSGGDDPGSSSSTFSPDVGGGGGGDDLKDDPGSFSSE